jgi:hypothetical protein
LLLREFASTLVQIFQVETTHQTNDVRDEHRPKEMPGKLNTLTILTFIGCGIGFIFSLWGFFATTPEKLAKTQEQRAKLDDGTFRANMLDSSIQAMQISLDNKYLLLITNLVCLTLCLVGALQMRKLKQPGYYLYVAGELAPVVLMAGLIGSLTGFNMIFSAVIALLFVILYATQLKYMETK